MDKKIKGIDPISGVLSTMRAMVSGNPHRADAFTDETATHIIDTCIGFDTGMWETGINPKGEGWIIVQQYASREDAAEGHQGWLTKMSDNPNTVLVDIDLWGLDQ